jgi:hypothetical protein
MTDSDNLTALIASGGSGGGYEVLTDSVGASPSTLHGGDSL